MSDEEFLAWLTSLDRRPVVLVEIDYYDFDASAEDTMYISDAGYTDKSDATSPLYEPLIRSKIIISSRIDGLLLSDIDVIDIFSRDFTRRQFVGYDCRVFYGDMRWPRSSFRQQCFQKVKDFLVIQDKQYRLTFENLDSRYYDQKISSTVSLPLVLGTAFNVQPLRVSADEFIFYTPTDDIDIVVRDAGVVLTLTTDYTFAVTAHTVGYKVEITTDSPPVGEVTIDAETTDPESSYLGNILESLAPYLSNAPDILSQGMPEIVIGYCLYEHNQFGQFIDDAFAGFQMHTRINELGLVQAFSIYSVNTASYRDVGPQNIFGSLKMERRDPPYIEIDYGYERKWLVQTTNLAGSLTDAEYFRWGNEFAFENDTNTLPAYPFLSPQRITGAVALQADAQSLVDSIMEYRSTDHQLWAFSGDMSFLGDKVSGTIRITHDDNGWQDGDYLVIVEIRANLSSQTIEIKGYK